MDWYGLEDSDRLIYKSKGLAREGGGRGWMDREGKAGEED